MAAPPNADQVPPAAAAGPSAGYGSGSGNLAGWIEARLPVFSVFRREFIDSPTPRNLNYLWNFGAISTLALLMLMLSGVFLSLGYTPTAAGAFGSVEAIDREVSSGWILRSVHMAGTSLFFAALYVHTWRALYYGSYKRPRELLWLTGMALMVMVLVAAFAGYVLPWGQMSYWSAVAAGNAVAALPGVGPRLAAWLQGGPQLGDASLHRFYTLHVVVGWLILGAVVLHVAALRFVGSNNPLGIDVAGPQDTLPFHPFYTAKRGVGLCVFLIVLAVLVFYLPGWLTRPENYVEGNPYSAPLDIVPEWYVAPFYAVLRAVPSRFGGLLLSAGMVLVLFAAPWLDTSPVRSARFRPLYRRSMVLLTLSFLVLLVCGMHPPVGLWLLLSRLATLYWFAHFLLLMPLLGSVERPLKLPRSIGAAVLREGRGMTPAARGVRPRPTRPAELERG